MANIICPHCEMTCRWRSFCSECGQPLPPMPRSQTAGSYIAQADRGSTASINISVGGDVQEGGIKVTSNKEDELWINGVQFDPKTMLPIKKG